MSTPKSAYQPETLVSINFSVVPFDDTAIAATRTALQNRTVPVGVLYDSIQFHFCRAHDTDSSLSFKLLCQWITLLEEIFGYEIGLIGGSVFEKYLGTLPTGLGFVDGIRATVESIYSDLPKGVLDEGFHQPVLRALLQRMVNHAMGFKPGENLHTVGLAISLLIDPEVNDRAWDMDRITEEQALALVEVFAIAQRAPEANP